LKEIVAIRVEDSVIATDVGVKHLIRAAMHHTSLATELVNE
jgi:hypothetical protein